MSAKSLTSSDFWSNWRRLRRAILLGWFALTAVAPGRMGLQAARLQGETSVPRQRPIPSLSQRPDNPSPNVATARAVLDRYCVTCHNARLKTAGLLLDQLDVDHVGSNRDVWEKVARKLRTREMPPPAAPRPDEATYRSVASLLETSLDAAAAAAPHPGRVPVHRLNRTEYANAIRDLLALEVDGRSLLPNDEPDPYGFDNVASVLTVSPALLESYMAAAADGQPAGGRGSCDQSGRRHVQGAHRARAGRSDRRASGVRIARRHVDSLSVPARRRVHHQGRPEAAAVPLSRRDGRAAPDRSAAGRRAAQAVHRGRRGQGHDGARELRRQHAGRSGVGSVHAHGGRRPRGPRAGQGGDARGAASRSSESIGSRKASCSRRSVASPAPPTSCITAIRPWTPS